MHPAQLRDVYKQLKNISAKQNDKPEELRFYGLEMDAYRNEIKSVKGKRFDRWILAFNRVTNEHGQSWNRPLAIILTLLVILYFPIKALLGFTHFSLNANSTTTAVSEMVECFNPVRKFSDSFGQPGPTVQPWRTALAKIIDSLFLRLIVGLLIFQMVKAFRKYVR